MVRLYMKYLSAVFFLLSGLLLMTGLPSCATKKAVTSSVSIPPDTYKPQPSKIILHFKMDKKAIRDTFNSAIAEIFKENFDIPDYDVKMNFYKTKEGTVEIEGKNILVNIPVGILVEKNTFLVNMKARGVIELSFITKFDLDTSWNFKAKTDLSYYKWLEKPVLQMGGVSLPIEPISNVIVAKTKPYIIENIDAAIAENFTIKQSIHESMQIFRDPIQLDENSGGFLTMKPQKIYLQPLKNSKLYTSGKIGVDLSTVFSSYKPATVEKTVATPTLYWSESLQDTSLFSLVTNIKMMDLNEMVRKNYEGKTFTSQGKSFTLGSIFLNCDYEKIRFASDVTGSINGTLLISAKPWYDFATHSFKAKDIEFSFKTKNKIHKAASWIAEGYIRKELEKIFDFPLAGQLDEIQNSINSQLDEINKTYNMDIQAKIGSITSDRFYMKPGELETTILAKVYLQAYIKDLRTFGSMK